uniref:Fibroblast growth factor n=1 Tax=Laticauda laticaudata TaxID=8630 RepID=A0A8C5SF32_LATLA
DGDGRSAKPAAPLALLGLCFVAAVRSVPLADAGPHVYLRLGGPNPVQAPLHGQPARPRSAISSGSTGDGRVDGAAAQSLLEIRAVALRTVAIKGVHSSRYLCMEEGGRLHGLLIYTTENCSFEEEIRPDGYNIYKSKKYGILVSLSNARQRQQYKGKDFLPLSHFLPMMNTVPVETTDFGEYSDTRQNLESGIFHQPVETDSMDPFGITSEVSLVQSPSFG